MGVLPDLADGTDVVRRDRHRSHPVRLVNLADPLLEVRQHAGQILGMMLKTHQTGAQGQKVRRLLIEEGADIKKELYVGMVVDRGSQRVALMASSEGGMDIEEVAATKPEALAKIRPAFGGVQTGGNSSGVVDGAAAAVVASGAYVKEKGLKPIAQVIASATVGVPPEVMGIGPAPAIRKLLGVTLRYPTYREGIPAAILET